MNPAHLSIHDVAPDTLPEVTEMLSKLKAAGIGPVMLLVIPGLEWQAAQIDHLREWVGQGHVLAAHGWVHHVDQRRTWKHKLHGVVLSRYVAEHLSLSSEEIIDLMRRSYEWFPKKGLPAPTHYVPPAWGLGEISMEQLSGLPYRTVEVLSGVIYPQEHRILKMPLVGYEADTYLRSVFLGAFNAWNRKQASEQTVIRLSLHPYDFTYKRAQDILPDCRRYTCRPELP